MGERLTPNNDMQNWKTLAEERGRALADAEKECQAWKTTAQMAEEWADQLGKVRLWLQERLYAQSKELSESLQQKDEALAELATVQEQCLTAKTEVLRKQEELERLERHLRALEASRLYRTVRWFRLKVQGLQTQFRRVASQGVGLPFRLRRFGGIPGKR